MALSEDAAASRIQGLYRTRRARQMVADLITGTFEKVYDEESGEYFYFNSKTGESTWEKPSIVSGVGAKVLTPRARESYVAVQEKKKRGEFKYARDMSPDEAAKMLQGLFRSRAARQQIQQLLVSIVEKIYDPETDNYYYYNSKTGETSWFKPRLLGDKELLAENEVEEQVDLVEIPSGPQAKTSRASIKPFLKKLGLNFLQKELEDEGFDDMEALLALTSADAFEIGLKVKHVKHLIEGLRSYKLDHGIEVANESEESDDEIDGESEALSNLVLAKKPSAPRNSQKAIGDGTENGDDIQAFEGEHDGLGDIGEDFNDEDFEDEEEHDDDSYDATSDEEEDAQSVDLDKPIPGVDIEVLFPGDGENFPVKGEYARVHYSASTMDGTVFESSRKRGRAFEFFVGAGHVIRGWDLGIRKMSKGERSRLTIDPELAYGDIGRKPVVQPGARLVFEVELIDMYVAEVGHLPEEFVDDG